MPKKKINLSKRKSILLGIIILILGISLLSHDYVMAKKSYAFDYMNNKLYLSSSENPDYIDSEEEEGVTSDEDTYDDNLNVKKIEQNTNNKEKTSGYYYIGYLEIPKIKFKKGFVDINSQDNVVSRNITIISGSSFPNVAKGNFIIAGHSGTGIHSYFKNLYKLSKNDKAYVYYSGVKYTYNIVKIYKQPKNGSIAIYRNYDKTTLTLVTCTKDDKTSQTVYILELVNKVNY